MHGIPTAVVAFSLYAGTVHDQDRIDELFKSWQTAQRTVRSLVVDFTLEKNEFIFKKKTKTKGTVRFLRTADGKVYASYTVGMDNGQTLQGLLYDYSYYALGLNKTAIQWNLQPQELHRGCVNINPMLMLLDRKYTETNCRLKIAKHDKQYTYLEIKLGSNKPNRDLLLDMDFVEGRVVLMNKTSKVIPRHMPRQVWFRNHTTEYTFDIQSWRVNAQEGPKKNEFVALENRAGWRVWEWRNLFNIKTDR